MWQPTLVLLSLCSYEFVTEDGRADSNYEQEQKMAAIEGTMYCAESSILQSISYLSGL
jgi:hypothetical protein